MEIKVTNWTMDAIYKLDWILQYRFNSSNFIDYIFNATNVFLYSSMYISVNFLFASYYYYRPEVFQ